MRDAQSGSAKERHDRNRAPQSSDITGSEHQADGADGTTGMGAFSDGEFQGGAEDPGPQETATGYGQDVDLRGGYGQGSGYAQSSDAGGYGQGAEQQGGPGTSGADQHSDERYLQHGEQGEQRLSPHGYGGRGGRQESEEGTAKPDDADQSARSNTDALEGQGGKDSSAPPADASAESHEQPRGR